MKTWYGCGQLRGCEFVVTSLTHLLLWIFVCCLHSSPTHVAFWMKFEPFAFFLFETQLGFCSRFRWTAHKPPFVITSFLAVLRLTNYKGSTYVGHSNIIIVQGQLQHMYTCWIINLFFDFTSKNRICLTIRFALLRASHIICFGWRIVKVMLVWGSKIALKSLTFSLDWVHRIICPSGLLLVVFHLLLS